MALCNHRQHVSKEARADLSAPWHREASPAMTRSYHEHFWRNTKEAAHTAGQKRGKQSAPIVSQVPAIHLISMFHHIWYFSPYICFLFCWQPFCLLQLPYRLGLNRMSLKFLLSHSSQTYQDCKINTTKISTGSVPIRKYQLTESENAKSNLVTMSFFTLTRCTLFWNSFCPTGQIFSSVWWSETKDDAALHYATDHNNFSSTLQFKAVYLIEK